MDQKNITALRMERQYLHRPARMDEYLALYHDTQPGQNVYWNGFGNPPSITFRAGFDDMEFNRARQMERELVKGRFQGGTLGWIERGEMELFACLFRKPLPKLTPAQACLLELIEREGPLTIQVMKECTGLLVKEITPVLHRLQEAFLIYEDQYDGEWDRGWYPFREMFPEVSFEAYTRQEALQILLKRFAYRNVQFRADMAKSFYRLPLREIKQAILELNRQGVLIEEGGAYLLRRDAELLESRKFSISPGVFAMHRNDFLVKSNEFWLKPQFLREGLDTLQYLLIDGEFLGAVYGHFKNGPYLIEDVVVPSSLAERKDEIIAAVYRVNDPARSPIQRYMGKPME